MLITTALNGRLFSSDPVMLDWPRPRVLMLTPQAPLDQAARAAAEGRFIVFDFTAPPTSWLAAIGTVFVRLRRSMIRMDAPLLFTREAMPPEDYADWAGRAAAPSAVEAAFDPGTAELSTLALGLQIMKNPLLETFFRNLSPDLPEASTTQSLDVLRAHFLREA